MTALIVILVIIALLVFWMVSIYNQLVTLKGRFENGFAQIEVQLKRRYDLIPNLVETAKAYLKHESETLTKVTEARNQALASLKAASAQPGNPDAIKALSAAEKQLTTSLGSFNLQMEAYPDLKASDNMAQLTEELTATENRVAFARQAFNDAVTNYNIYRQSFPNVIIANSFGHTQDAELLEFEDSAAIQAAPKVSF
ncbi:LemA family protein [Gallaecimonas sp. GXIMD1310]|uniref:LemA family protein n=1 Tax=Gallaecimonas sp. GXIMD1310 TaxID=3131926 RepID=UPI00324D2176